MFDLTHTEYILDSDGDYNHVSIAESKSLSEMQKIISEIDTGLRYQYYITEWDEEDILEQTSAEEWMVNV